MRLGLRHAAHSGRVGRGDVATGCILPTLEVALLVQEHRHVAPIATEGGARGAAARWRCGADSLAAVAVDAVVPVHAVGKAAPAGRYVGIRAVWQRGRTWLRQRGQGLAGQRPVGPIQLDQLSCRDWAIQQVRRQGGASWSQRRQPRRQQRQHQQHTGQRPAAVHVHIAEAPQAAPTLEANGTEAGADCMSPKRAARVKSGHLKNG